MPEPLVSIVMPTHNREADLPGAIESVLDQRFADWELILVDDASADGTPAIVARYAERDARIRSLRNPQNLKIAGTLNRGFGASRGKLLTWSADDNWYRPEAIGRMVGILDAEPRVGMVYTGYMKVDGAGRDVGYQPALDPDLLATRSVVGGCFLYRRSVYEAVGDYDATLFPAEDFDYWIRIRKAFPMLAVDEDHYRFRFHEDALSTKQEAAVLHATRLTLERHVDRMDWLDARGRARVRFEIAVHAFYERDLAGLRRNLRPVLRHDPALVLKNFKRGLAAFVLGQDYLDRVAGESAARHRVANVR